MILADGSSSTKGDGASETSVIRIKHTKAFEELSTFLKYEIVQKRRPLMASTIFNLYREEYLGVGGTLDEFSDYSVQSLLNKVKKITGLQIDKESNKTGSFVFPSSMTTEEAKILVRNSSFHTVLNRQGHAIFYYTVKELETEIAYSCSSEDRETPSGLPQSDILATGMYRVTNI